MMNVLKTIEVSNLQTAGGNDAPNQYNIRVDNGVAFQSYNSLIATIKDDVITIYPDWDYSNTTMKYLKWWLEDNTRLDWSAKIVRTALVNGEIGRYTVVTGDYNED